MARITASARSDLVRGGTGRAYRIQCRGWWEHRHNGATGINHCIRMAHPDRAAGGVSFSWLRSGFFSRLLQLPHAEIIKQHLSAFAAGDPEFDAGLLHAEVGAGGAQRFLALYARENIGSFELELQGVPLVLREIPGSRC